MAKKVFILGAGLIGRPMALDLLKHNEFEVGIADINPSFPTLFEGTAASCLVCDLREPKNWLETARSYDLFINAVPGFMGYESLRALISLGKPVVDIAFYPEDPLSLDEAARQSGAVVVCDMGVAPGMSHLLSGYAAAALQKLDKLIIYVGGLPVERKLPWQYKAVFSPNDVIEEYTRPARLIENGCLVSKEALSDAEFIDFDHVGTLEAFNSDGLRTLVHTLKADFMAEKTLRYPGHIDLIKALKKSGFFENQTIISNGMHFVPLDFTKALLFNQWKLGQGEADLTVMRIIAEGTVAGGQKQSIRFDLFDTADLDSGIHSMARTTGYAATSALRMLAAGLLTQPGIHMPELLGSNNAIVNFMLNDQHQRGISYVKSVSQM